MSAKPQGRWCRLFVFITAAVGIAIAGRAAQATETTTYVLTDAQGTVLAREDAHGTTIAEYDYRPYGMQQAGPATVGPGYTGHVDDPDIGLVYMQARYYDPEIGRFLSTDPIQRGASNDFGSRYAYVHNNPVINIDPFGLYTCSGGKEGDCEVIEQARQDVISAAKNLPAGSDAQKDLQSIADFYGKPGEDNGVHVVINAGTVNGKNIGGGTNRTKKGITIGINLSRIREVSKQAGDQVSIRIAGVVAHEGKHGFEMKINGWDPKSRAVERAGEVRAYTSQAELFWGLGAEPPNPGNLWSSWTGIYGPNINKQADKSADAWCAASGGAPDGC